MKTAVCEQSGMFQGLMFWEVLLWGLQVADLCAVAGEVLGATGTCSTCHCCLILCNYLIYCWILLLYTISVLLVLRTRVIVSIFFLARQTWLSCMSLSVMNAGPQQLLYISFPIIVSAVYCHMGQKFLWTSFSTRYHDESVEPYYRVW